MKLVKAMQKITSGNYAGNDAQNRGIPHSIGRVPKAVFIQSQSANAFGSHIQLNRMVVPGGADTAVTASDETNFYVGDNPATVSGMNQVGNTYYWVAVG